eukprot:gene1586-1841_t
MDTMAQLVNVPPALEPQSALGTEYAKRFRNLLTWITTTKRVCKYGIDPLYLDDSATIKYATYDFAVLTTSSTIDFTDGTPSKGQAYFAIRFYDAQGEDWITTKIPTGASCATVVEILEALPNNVIPSGSLYCTLTKHVNVDILSWNGIDAQGPSSGSKEKVIKYPMAFWQVAIQNSYQYPNYGPTPALKLSGYVYRIKFYGNPGYLKQPEIEIYLDGKRASLQAQKPKGQIITAVWTDGQQGEFVDYFADHCDGVTVTIAFNKFDLGGGMAVPYYYLSGLTVAEKALLKDCLGTSDFDDSNNVEVYDWDFGSFQYPHIVKLVKSVTTFTDGGYYVALYYDTATPQSYITDPLYSSTGYGLQGNFRLLNPFQSPRDNFDTNNLPNISPDEWEVYTTKSVLALTSNYSEAAFGFGSQ